VRILRACGRGGKEGQRDRPMDGGQTGVQKRCFDQSPPPQRGLTPTRVGGQTYAAGPYRARSAQDSPWPGSMCAMHGDDLDEQATCR
jgi:hypothetical protein